MKFENTESSIELSSNIKNGTYGVIDVSDNDNIYIEEPRQGTIWDKPLNPSINFFGVVYEGSSLYEILDYNKISYDTVGAEFIRDNKNMIKINKFSKEFKFTPELLEEFKQMITTDIALNKNLTVNQILTFAEEYEVNNPTRVGIERTLIQERELSIVHIRRLLYSTYNMRELCKYHKFTEKQLELYLPILDPVIISKNQDLDFRLCSRLINEFTLDKYDIEYNIAVYQQIPFSYMTTLLTMMTTCQISTAIIHGNYTLNEVIQMLEKLKELNYFAKYKFSEINKLKTVCYREYKEDIEILYNVLPELMETKYSSSK